MAKAPKFVNIAFSGEQVLALDNNGKVWLYVNEVDESFVPTRKRIGWEPLSENEVEEIRDPKEKRIDEVKL